MYGFTIACFLGGIPHVDLHLNLMSQPPWDSELKLSAHRPFYILHYTYGACGNQAFADLIRW